MEPMPEKLDLDALVKSGKIQGSSKPQQSFSSPNIGSSRPIELVSVIEDDVVVDDTSSWSDSDEGNVVDGGEEVESEEEKEEVEVSASAASSVVKSLMDPLQIYGDLSANLNKYEARYDPASVKFDAAALLSGVHYATSYDKLRAALDALKSEIAKSGQNAQHGVILGIGMTESDNFDRFVATSNTVNAFRENVLSAGLGGGGTWCQQMDDGFAGTSKELETALQGVMDLRKQIRSHERILQFARRYRTVLKLPDTLKGLVSSPSGYLQAAREYRKAQRVLRGTSGRVFRSVLSELEDVAQKWKTSMYAVLGTEFTGGPSNVELVVESVRALREMGSAPDPAVYFAQQQHVHSQLRVTQNPSIAEAFKVLPALTLAYSKLGAGTTEGMGQAAVWGTVFDVCCEAVKANVNESNMQSLLVEAQQLWERVSQAVGSAKDKQPCHSVVAGLVYWLRQCVAQLITQRGIRQCGRMDGTPSEGLQLAVETIKQLIPVVGETVAVEVGLSCMCKCVDAIVHRCDVAVDAPTPADNAQKSYFGSDAADDVFLKCAVQARSLSQDGVAAIHQIAPNNACQSFIELCEQAVSRALRAFETRMMLRICAQVSHGVRADLLPHITSRLDARGALTRACVPSPNINSATSNTNPSSGSNSASSSSSGSLPSANANPTEKSTVPDWAEEALVALSVAAGCCERHGLVDIRSVVVERGAAGAVRAAEEALVSFSNALEKKVVARVMAGIRLIAEVSQSQVALQNAVSASKALGLKPPSVADDVARLSVLKRILSPNA